MSTNTDLADERNAAIRRAEYWKAEHLAANAVIDRLNARLSEAAPIIHGLLSYFQKPDSHVEPERLVEAAQRWISPTE